MLAVVSLGWTASVVLSPRTWFADRGSPARSAEVDLRHSFGTIAANAALSGRELQAWMGHADYRTTQRYLHSRERGDEAARLALAFATEVAETVAPVARESLARPADGVD